MSISRKRGLAGGAQYTVGLRRVKPCCGITGSRFPGRQKYPVTPDHAKIIRSNGDADKIVTTAVSGIVDRTAGTEAIRVYCFFLFGLARNKAACEGCDRQCQADEDTQPFGVGG